MTEIDQRILFTSEKKKEINKLLKTSKKIMKGKACVYATGSYGRLEACEHSDLDLFIVSQVETDPDIKHSKPKSLLRNLDEICVKAELIDATRRLKIPDFDGDGKYLVHHTVEDFTKTLGKAEDDVTNTFTARLLLLLESQPIVENEIYFETVQQVTTAYWRDYQDHKNDFMPAFLANDILRLWRTFCVNYEARTEREPDRLKIKGKIKNYKLKHSRLLTCYSALLFLLKCFKQSKTVSPEDIKRMISLSPLSRLEWLTEQGRDKQSRELVSRLREQYVEFLEKTNVDSDRLEEIFADKKNSNHYLSEAFQFGDSMFELLNHIGQGDRFHRLMVV